MGAESLSDQKRTAENLAVKSEDSSMAIPRLTYFPDSNIHGFSAEIDNAPGSLRRILDELSKEDCNLIALEGFSPPQADAGKMYLVADLTGQQKNPKDVENLLRMSKAVRSVRHIEPLTIGLLADTGHFPLELIPGRGRCFITSESVWHALFGSGYDRLGADATRDVANLEAEDMIRIILHEGKALGWWDGRGESNLTRNQLVLKLYRNWEGELTKRWKVGCHFVRGYWDAVVSELLGRRVQLIETTCISKGSQYCELRPI